MTASLSGIHGTRAANALINAKRDADRAGRLDPAKVDLWTDLISEAAKFVVRGKRPCSYAPWEEALVACAQSRDFKNLDNREAPYVSIDLMRLAADIAQPGWPAPRADLIAFALAFLEADVMLFRSGYTKRHLIRRLQQSPLTDDQMKRVDVLLRRVVTAGAGLEEFRAYCKMAAHLAVNGHGGDLTDWLAEQANDAILTARWWGAENYAAFTRNPALSDHELRKLHQFRLWSGYRWGLAYPELTQIVPAGKHLKEPQNQIKINAYLMLRAIKRRQVSER